MGVGWCEQLLRWASAGASSWLAGSAACCRLVPLSTAAQQLGILHRADALLPLLHMAMQRAAGGGDVGVD